MTDGMVEFIEEQLAEDEATIKAMGAEGAGRWWVGQRFDGSLDPDGSTVFVDVRRSDGLGYIHLGAPGMFAGPTATHIARHDPATVLADVAAKRAIIAMHELCEQKNSADMVCRGAPEFYRYCECQSEDGMIHGAWPCDTLKHLVAPYASRPGFKDEWRLP